MKKTISNTTSENQDEADVTSPSVPSRLLSLCSIKRSYTYTAAVVATVLVLLGYLLSPDGGELWQVIANRLLAIFVILLIALICLWQRRVIGEGLILQQEKHLYESENLIIRQLLDEQMLSEAALQEREARIRAVVETAAEGIITIDDRGIVESLNDAATKMFGYQPEEVIGNNVSTLMPSPYVEQYDQYLSNYLRTGNAKMIGIGREVEGKHKDGTTFPVHLSISEVHVGERRLFTGILSNLTERNKLQLQLTQAQKLESIGQLAAGIAHETNTPLQYVGDNTRFLESAFADVENVLTQYDKLLQVVKADGYQDELVREVEEALRQADTSYLSEEIPLSIGQSLYGIEQATTIVQAMKEFSHPGATEKTPIDLNHAIQTTVAVASSEWRYVAEMAVNLDPELPFVPCLPGEFNQLILNLIVNSAHAVSEKMSSETDHLEAAEKGTITISTRQYGDWAEICIGDTGAGIPAEIQARIFDPFFTTKDVGKGTGQSLSIAYAVVVEKHNGTIQFKSEVNKGTTFTIRLPISSGNEATKEKKNEETYTVC